MLVEWLVRKITGWEKPPQKNAEARDGTSESVKADDKKEPVLDSRRPTLIVPEEQSGGAKTTPPPLIATREAEPAAPAQPVHEHLAAPEHLEEKSGSVHVFNFKAWFTADPVKASLTLGLAFLSWLATYTGMLELIQANTGSLDIGSRVAIGFAVMMLMLMILYLLDSLYSGTTPNWLKPVFIFGYLFLTLISVGFGFGFYWKYLEAQTEATRSAESAVSQVQVALQIGQSRLEQLQSTFTQLTTVSATKATQEREHGNSCPNSSPGAGPRMRLRDSDSQKFGYAAQYITGRATTVNADLNALNADLKKVVSRAPSTVGADGTRNKFMRALGRKLDLTIARFNTLRTDPQLVQFRENFDKRANTTVFPNGRGGSFKCPDVQLQTALRGVVRAIDDIPEIKNPKVAAVEGSEAIVEAFRRLAVTLAALPTLKLPPSPDELRKARKQAISSGKKITEVSNIDPGLSKRDYIPLSAAVFVDLCILLISLNRRYNNFEKFHRSVASAEAGAIGNTMLDIFEAHQNKFSEEMLEIFHHAEFEYGRDYYIAVPLIKGSKKAILNERLYAKQEQASLVEHSAIDEEIGVQEVELKRRLSDQNNAEGMKHKLGEELAALNGSKKQLLQNQHQLTIANKKNPGQSELVEASNNVEQQIATNEAQLESFSQQNVEAIRLSARLTDLVKETKGHISVLKKQKAELLRREQSEIEQQISTTAVYDLAKEARFLSNLCISLEANDILHLASIYPFQFQVRTQLKKHDSRYYAEDRHYRVYRFRKVADTQSQMVLDLIMEAAKRSRDEGDIHHVRPSKERQEEERKAEEQAQLAAQAEHDRMVEQIKIDLKSDLTANMRTEVKEEVEAKVSSEVAAKQQADLIDRNAPDAEVVNLTDIQKKSGKHSQEVSKVVAASIGEKGIGASIEDLAHFINDGAKTPPEAAGKVEVPIVSDLSALRAKEAVPGPVGHTVAGRFSKVARSLFGAVPSGVAQSAEELPQSNSSKTPDLERERVVQQEMVAEPGPERESESKQEQEPEPESEREPFVNPEPVIEEKAPDEDVLDSTNALTAEPLDAGADVQETMTAERGSFEQDPRDRVNFGSLPTAPVPEESASFEEPDMEKRTTLQEKMDAISNQLPDVDSVETEMEFVTKSSEEEIIGAARLTQPVIADTANNLNQDPGDRPDIEIRTRTTSSSYEFPSEADGLEMGGALPSSLRPDAPVEGDDTLSEIAEENGARSMAKRFVRNTEEK